MSKIAVDNAANSVGIIGCGWLGRPLAGLLMKENTQVMATSTREEKAAELNQVGIDSRVLQLPQAPSQLSGHDIFSCRKLVVCITPQLKKGRVDYPEKIAGLVAAAEKNGVEKIILLSTSSVYNGLEGEVFEEAGLDVNANKVAILAQAEQSVLNFNGLSAVLRLSGLIGPARHPGRFLAGKKDLANPDAAVNLIHQADALGLINCLLKQKQVQGIFNGVANTRMSRQQFYQQAALALSLPEPAFNDLDRGITGKVINGDKGRRELSYQYQYDDLVLWMKNNEN
ncbi:SDR family NAD(P)-dependent oxidoreductase [Thalassomonas haliotis]|uniref:SDR family NAD(P)-dependent oxidoreductase n=1 Tax=Thalassomonas haliotis TaxID=485448 RepID=UPI002362ECB3|nr:SDR family NAD(P)-dependent oxidoreductase [Thalassomonas haliotis]